MLKRYLNENIRVLDIQGRLVTGCPAANIDTRVKEYLQCLEMIEKKVRGEETTITIEKDALKSPGNDKNDPGATLQSACDL